MPWGNTDSHWGVRNTSWGDQNQTKFSTSKRKSDSSNCSKSTSTAKRNCPPQNSVSSFTQSTSSKIEEKKAAINLLQHPVMSISQLMILMHHLEQTVHKNPPMTKLFQKNPHTNIEL